MKKNMKYFVMAVVALLSMSACNNELDEQAPAAKGNVVSFQMGLVNTKTTTSTDYITTFVKGDAVGIFAYERNTDGTDGTLAVTNAKYVLNADGATWTAADAQNAAYADANTAFNYYAYYPYQEGITDPTTINMAVKLDQSTAAAADYNLSDALTAQNKTVEKNSTNVTLAFKHAFALVQVNLDGLAADKDAIVTLQNVYPQATLNLLTQVVGNANGTNGSIKMYSLPEINQVEKANRFAFRAIVPAQSITTGTTLAEIQSKGKTYRFTYSTNVDYVASKLRVMNITLGGAPEKNTITIPASNMTVDKWGTTEEGSGSGSVEEALLINKFGASLVDVIDNPTSLTADSWFALKKTGLTNTANASLVDDESTTWKKAAKLEYTGDTAGGNSWFKAAIGYYHTTPMDLSSTSIYKMTLKIKAGNNGSAISKLVFTCRSASNLTSFQMSTNAEFIGTEATTVTKGPSAAETWETFTLYINFAKQSITVGTATLTDTTPTDYAKFDFRVYTGTDKSLTNTIYISDVVLEPYVAIP